jgi:hypothetical protein
MQLTEAPVFQSSLDERPQQQESAYEGGRRFAVQFVEPSDVQSDWLEEMTVIQNLPLEGVYSYHGPIIPIDWITSRGLTATPLGFADTAKYIVADKAVSLSASLRQSIKELSELPDGWDGGRAKPIKMDVLNDVVRFLKWLTQQPLYSEPFIVPTFDGLVQMEWHDEKRSLDIEAGKEGWAVGGTLIVSDRQRVYFDANCGSRDFEKLRNFYDWFSGKESIWPSA